MRGAATTKRLPKGASAKDLSVFCGTKKGTTSLFGPRGTPHGSGSGLSSLHRSAADTKDKHSVDTNAEGSDEDGYRTPTRRDRREKPEDALSAEKTANAARRGGKVVDIDRDQARMLERLIVQEDNEEKLNKYHHAQGVTVCD